MLLFIHVFAYINRLFLLLQSHILINIPKWVYPVTRWWPFALFPFSFFFFFNHFSLPVSPQIIDSFICLNEINFYFIFILFCALALHCCVRAFSSCSEQELLFVVVHRLLIAVASPLSEHRL